ADSNCPTGYTDAGGYCYNFTDVALPWDQAKTYCDQNNGHLIVEATADEHVVFLNYRQNLPNQGDPMWQGIYVVPSGGNWQWLSDAGLLNPLYTNFQNGKIPPSTPGRCVASNEVNSAQVWQSWDCTTPLYFLCEPSRYAHNWVKVYPDSSYKRSNVVVNANTARTRSLVSCAVTCSTVAGCAAFNHQRADNRCQFILSEVPDKTYVIDQSGWDVWVDFPPPA
ncbi:unnamed protein product, partial [Candidula unifasciata]